MKLGPGSYVLRYVHLSICLPVSVYNNSKSKKTFFLGMDRQKEEVTEILERSGSYSGYIKKDLKRRP